MKKLLSFALIMMVCCTSALMFGCSAKNGTMAITCPASFSITQATINDEMAYIDFVDAQLKTITIEVKDEDGNVKFPSGTLYDARIQGASIMGFTLKSAGKHTAKVSMFGVTETFEYEVTIS